MQEIAVYIAKGRQERSETIHAGLRAAFRAVGTVLRRTLGAPRKFYLPIPERHLRPSN